MNKDHYYDTLHKCCEECFFLKSGIYQNGQVYKACGNYGYILKRDPIDEPCDDFRTPEQQETYLKQKELLKKKKK